MKGVIDITIYREDKKVQHQYIKFNLTKEEISKALKKANGFLRNGEKKFLIEPMKIPFPEEEQHNYVVPLWLIYEITDSVPELNTDTINKLFSILREKGWLVYKEDIYEF